MGSSRFLVVDGNYGGEMVINVDLDGTLFSRKMEYLLLCRENKTHEGFHKSSVLWDWYESANYTNRNKINTQLLDWLGKYKNQGHIIRVWTNRNYELHKYVIRDLREWSSLFDKFQYYEGEKGKSFVEGVVIDNEQKYIKCGEKGGIYYPTFY